MFIEIMLVIDIRLRPPACPADRESNGALLYFSINMRCRWYRLIIKNQKNRNKSLERLIHPGNQTG
jgi:hypothetical protein